MLELYNPFLLRYKNDDFIDFMRMVLAIYKSEDVKDEVLMFRINKLQEMYDTISEEARKRKGHYLTPKTQELDVERRSKIKGVRWFLESQQYRELKQNVVAAKILLDDFKRFGKKIERARIKLATALISQILMRWTTEKDLKAAVQTLGIQGWLENISEVNADFNQMHFQKMNKSDKRSNLYPMKQKAKVLYETLTRDTLAFIYLAKGDHPYEAIIEALNNLTKRYNTNYKIRQGIRKSKKRKNVDSNGRSDQ